MDFRKLRHLVAVAQARSFTRAATALHISQPALSRSISDFEKQLGEPLFDRTSEGVIPTAFGAPVIAQAERILAEVDHFTRELEARTGGETGTLAFGAGPLVAALTFREILAHFADHHPKLAIETQIAPGGILSEGLRQGRIEFAVFSEALLGDDRGLDVERIGTLQLGYVVRSDHPLAGRTNVSRADLSAYAVVSGGTLGMERGPSTNTENLARPGINCEDFGILREMVLTSNAVWLTSISMADEADGLVLLEGEATPRRQTTLVLARPTGRSLSPPAREAASIMRRAFARPD